MNICVLATSASRPSIPTAPIIFIGSNSYDPPRFSIPLLPAAAGKYGVPYRTKEDWDVVDGKSMLTDHGDILFLRHHQREGFCNFSSLLKILTMATRIHGFNASFTT